MPEELNLPYKINNPFYKKNQNQFHFMKTKNAQSS